MQCRGQGTNIVAGDNISLWRSHCRSARWNAVIRISVWSWLMVWCKMLPWGDEMLYLTTFDPSESRRKYVDENEDEMSGRNDVLQCQRVKWYTWYRNTGTETLYKMSFHSIAFPGMNYWGGWTVGIKSRKPPLTDVLIITNCKELMNFFRTCESTTILKNRGIFICELWGTSCLWN